MINTKYILFGLFEKYESTDIQKVKIKSYKTNYRNKLEEKKREKYNLFHKLLSTETVTDKS